MTSYARFISLRAPTTGGAQDSVITSLMPERRRNKQKAQQATAPDDSENEGGIAAAMEVAAPEPLSIDTETMAAPGRRPTIHIGWRKP